MAFFSSTGTRCLPGMMISSVFLEAKKERGKAISTERIRAKKAICTVSNMESRYLTSLLVVRSGGKKPLSLISGLPAR